MSDAVCLRCRRPLEPERKGEVGVTLDGPVMLQALREVRADQDPEVAEALDVIAASLCPMCGREL